MSLKQVQVRVPARIWSSWRARGAINCLVMDLGIEPAGLWVVVSGSEQPYSQEGTE